MGFIPVGMHTLAPAVALPPFASKLATSALLSSTDADFDLLELTSPAGGADHTSLFLFMLAGLSGGLLTIFCMATLTVLASSAQWNPQDPRLRAGTAAIAELLISDDQDAVEQHYD